MPGVSENSQFQPARTKQHGDSTTAVESCGDVDLTARYLYTTPTQPDHSASELISSTRMHAAIENTTKSESTAYIEKYALDPTYLKQQLARREDGSRQNQQEVLKAEIAPNHLPFEEIVAEKVNNCGCGQPERNGPCLYFSKNYPEEASLRRARERADRGANREKWNAPTVPLDLESDIVGSRSAMNVKERLVKARLYPIDEEEDENENEQQTDEGDMSFEDHEKREDPRAQAGI